MQPLFSNALSKAGENRIKLSDTRRATLAWLALLIMRARHDLLAAVGSSWREPGANGFRAAAVLSIFPAWQTGRRGGRVGGRRSFGTFRQTLGSGRGSDALGVR